MLVVAVRVVFLLDARQEEHLVVHRQSERDAAHEDRCRDLEEAGGGEVERGGKMRWPFAYEPPSASTRATSRTRESVFAYDSTSPSRVCGSKPVVTTLAAPISCDEKLERKTSCTWRLLALAGSTRSSGSPKL